MTQEALKLALDALENHTAIKHPQQIHYRDKAITAIKEALAQPEQEPRNVRERWNVELDGNDLLVCFNDHEKGDKCQYERYSQQRTWEGLSVFEINDLVENTNYEDYRGLVEATEAKLKQKNGYAEEKNT